jgi:PAS domain S-box-containing protein
VAESTSNVPDPAMPREMDALSRAAFNAAPDPLVITNFDGTVVEINPRALEVLGYSREELIGMHPTQLLWDANPSRFEHELKSLQDGNPYRGEWQVRRKDGSMFHGEVVGRRLPNNKMIGMLRDLTAQKRAEQARKTLENQLIQAQKVQALGTLAGGIAHDFNNILSVIIGNTEIALQELAPTHPAHVSLEEIRKASRRGRDLVRQILIFSRQQPDERRVTPLEEVVEESVAMLRAALPAGVTLHSDCEPNTPAVLANRTQLHQVLMNLCANAWQSMDGREGRIDISLAGANLNGDSVPELGAGKYVRLSVTDNGKGMDATTLEHIFDPFFTTKEPGIGTGLGLPIVEVVVRSHKGAIRVKSKPGVGTTFDLYFPCATGSVERAPEEARQPQRGGSQRILYLDDEEPLMFLARRSLALLGYEVKGCTRPEEALEAFNADPAAFDLLVTDLNMPGISGLDVARECLKVRKDLPVMLASGYVTEELREKARALGIREIIYKPDLVEDLAQAIHRSLSQLG